MISARSAERDSLLFVYGTLRDFFDIPMARRLRREARGLGVARVAGRLYDLGRYPGIKRPRRRDEWVIGDLYRLRNAPRTLRALDRYEARFVRERVVVRIESRRACRAWLYRFRGPGRECNRIMGGDYKVYCLRREELRKKHRGDTG